MSINDGFFQFCFDKNHYYFQGTKSNIAPYLLPKVNAIDKNTEESEKLDQKKLIEPFLVLFC